MWSFVLLDMYWNNFLTLAMICKIWRTWQSQVNIKMNIAPLYNICSFAKQKSYFGLLEHFAKYQSTVAHSNVGGGVTGELQFCMQLDWSTVAHPNFFCLERRATVHFCSYRLCRLLASAKKKPISKIEGYLILNYICQICKINSVIHNIAAAIVPFSKCGGPNKNGDEFAWSIIF